jgi:hypothetical protein
MLRLYSGQRETFYTHFIESIRPGKSEIQTAEFDITTNPRCFGYTVQRLKQLFSSFVLNHAGAGKFQSAHNADLEEAIRHCSG